MSTKTSKAQSPATSVMVQNTVDEPSPPAPEKQEPSSSSEPSNNATSCGFSGNPNHMLTTDLNTALEALRSQGAADLSNTQVVMETEIPSVLWAWPCPNKEDPEYTQMAIDFPVYCARPTKQAPHQSILTYHIETAMRVLRDIRKTAHPPALPRGISDEQLLKLVVFMIVVESGGERTASNGSYKGLMQISATILKTYGPPKKTKDVFNTYDNMYAGMHYLMSYCFRDAINPEHTFGRAVRIYNGGYPRWTTQARNYLDKIRALNDIIGKNPELVA